MDRPPQIVAARAIFTGLVRRSLLFLAAGWVFAGAVAVAQKGARPAEDDRAADAGAQTAGAADPVFDVATVKPAAPSPDGHTHLNYPQDGRFSAINIGMLQLMGWVYGLPQKQILDGPAWMGSTRFDIVAKSDAETDGVLRTLSWDRGMEVKRRMVRALLADRFQLKVHEETRVLPAYDLVVAKGGSKLAVSQANGKSFGGGRGSLHGESLTMDIIAEQLGEVAGRVVVDKTNLRGRYDIKLRWTPDEAPTTEDSPPPLFPAIQEQLGLNLEPAKEPVRVLVIDRVELPSAN